MKHNQTTQDSIARLLGYTGADHALQLMANAAPPTTTLPAWVTQDYLRIFGGVQTPKDPGNAWGPSDSQRFPKTATGGREKPLT